MQKNINDDIIRRLSSNTPMKCLLAIRECVDNEIKDKDVIEKIKKLVKSELIEWNTQKVSDCAIAALDMLGVSKYSGDNMAIHDLIETNFYRN